MNYKLIVSIVPHNSGEFVVSTAKNAGASGGSVLMGKETASNGVIQLLGFGDSGKDIVFIIVEENLSKEVCNSIIELSKGKKANFGVLFTIDVGSFIKSGSSGKNNEGESKMDKENDFQMINLIVNKGYAEDAMAAARKAGAGGGTIINARGTAKEGDAKFFGMEIVPEKEMLMMLVPTAKKDEIIKAITDLPCFSKAGSGIVFCNGAQNFTVLGANK